MSILLFSNTKLSAAQQEDYKTELDVFNAFAREIAKTHGTSVRLASWVQFGSSILGWEVSTEDASFMFLVPEFAQLSFPLLRAQEVRYEQVTEILVHVLCEFFEVVEQV